MDPSFLKEKRPKETPELVKHDNQCNRCRSASPKVTEKLALHGRHDVVQMVITVLINLFTQVGVT
jgi:hypothetical protein